MSHQLNIVVAACDSMGIGIKGGIPWRLKKDMALFKKITMKTQDAEKRNCIIMGRKTWESIPPKFRPLQNRLNIILSSTLSEAPPGTVLVQNFTCALNEAEKNKVENIFVIGGASVYREAMTMNMPCKIFFTRVKGSFDCDTFFPEIDSNIFSKIENPDNIPTERLEENGISFSFEIYEKK